MQGCLRYPYPIRNPPLRLARRFQVPVQSRHQLRALLACSRIVGGSMHRSDSTTAAGAFKKASYNYEQLLSRL